MFMAAVTPYHHPTMDGYDDCQSDSPNDVPARDWVTDGQIRGQLAFIASFEGLTILSEPFVPRILLVGVEDLTCDDIDTFVVILVHWLRLRLVLLELLHGG